MKRLALVALTVFAAACSSGTPESSPPASTAPAASTPPAAAARPPRVLRRAAGWRDGQESRELDDSASRTTSSRRCPKGTVTTARPGMGHHHVGVDTDCLPPGTVIPKAAPWVHFGKGDARDRHAADARHAQAGAPDRRRHAHNDSRTLFDDHDHGRAVSSRRASTTVELRDSVESGTPGPLVSRSYGLLNASCNSFSLVATLAFCLVADTTDRGGDRIADLYTAVWL